MRRLQKAIGIFFWMMLFAIPVPARAELPPVLVELSETVHFLDGEGHDLVVVSGGYHVEPQETWLALMPLMANRRC